MKYRVLSLIDCEYYKNDILSCYTDNRFVFDDQNCITLSNADECKSFIEAYVQAPDSYVLGVFDDLEEYLYGLIIFDNVRVVGKDSIAQVHIVTNRAIWGKRIKDIYEQVLEYGLVETLYCEIPQIAVGAIAMCKRLGFRKTGYIPKALPYTNINGERKMYDLNIFVWERGKNA